MAQRDVNSGYNTNLASEYLMMSLLCRTGKEAYLSLGNKKGVDIIVKTKKGSICIIEVKGVNKKNDWLINNSGLMPSDYNMFFGFVYFQGKISEPTIVADFWLIPSIKLAETTEYKISKNSSTVYVSINHILKNYEEYKNTFDHLNLFLETN